MYVDVLPRVVKAIVLPGVTYYPVTRYYETPVMIRLTGKGVCKDYAYATAFIADSLGLIAVDMFGVDPRTNINRSLSVIIIPSSLAVHKGIKVIPDIDGDNIKEYLLPLVDTGRIPLDLLVKGGFTKHMIIDPGIPIVGMNPYRENIDYYWYVQYLEGLDRDYRSIASPFKPSWANKADKQMLLLAHLCTGITMNYTRLATELVKNGEITSRTFSWFNTAPNNIQEVFRLAVSNAILNIGSYTPNKWIRVFTKFFIGKIVAPLVTTINPVRIGNTTSIPEWYWNMIYRFWSIGSTIKPSNKSMNKPAKLLYITAYPIFQRRNNRYIFLEFHGEKIVNGTKYSVTVMPTAREGTVKIIVNIGKHTYIFYHKVTPKDWPVLRVNNLFDDYTGLVVLINKTIEYNVHIKINKTDDKLVIRSNYTGEFLAFTYYIKIVNNTFCMKVDIISGLPPVLAAEIIVYHKGNQGLVELVPLVSVVSVHGTTGGVVDMIEYSSIIGTLNDIDFIVVYVQVMAGYVTIYFVLSS